MRLYKYLAKKNPDLKDKLIQAQIQDTPELFLRKAYTLSLMGSFALSFLFIAPILYSLGKSLVPSLIAFPILFLMLRNYFMKMPDLYILKIQKNIQRELLFALRFLIVEIESGILIYKAFQNIRENYPTIGRYFGEVMDKIEYGTTVEEALNWGVKVCPSEHLRKVFIQIQNSLHTGSDVAKSLNNVVEQYSREEQIMLSEYSKKLNPIAMFYMIIAVIFPSIGFMMIVIISSFIGFKLDLSILFFIVAAIAFMQFMFVSMVKSIRPPVDM